MVLGNYEIGERFFFLSDGLRIQSDGSLWMGRYRWRLDLRARYVPGGRYVQQWELRMQAQEMTLKKVAISKVRGLLAYNKSFNCADSHFGARASPIKRRTSKALLVSEDQQKFSTSMKLGRRPPCAAKRSRWPVIARASN